MNHDAGKGSVMVRDSCALIRWKFIGRIGIPSHCNRKSLGCQRRAKPLCERQRYVFFCSTVSQLRSCVGSSMSRIQNDQVAKKCR